MNMSSWGGAGSACAEALEHLQLPAPLLRLRPPCRCVDHGDPPCQLGAAGLGGESVEAAIRALYGVQLREPRRIK